MSLGSSSSRHRRSSMKVCVGGAKVGLRTGLPLVPCPKCGDEVVELRVSELSKIPGQIFFKCRLHEKDVPGTCPFYMMAEKYEKFVQNMGGTFDHGQDVDQSKHELLDEVARLQDELGRVQGLVDALENGLVMVNADVQGLKAVLGSVDVKCTMLMKFGQLGLICQLVVALLVVILVK
ncbi:hypothetical protein BS78_05G188000 [Paspalum vaginatum]|nr:hypothetical protein BS78_05G188000 [Paspalum vaginatum]